VAADPFVQKTDDRPSLKGARQAAFDQAGAETLLFRSWPYRNLRAKSADLKNVRT